MGLAILMLCPYSIVLSNLKQYFDTCLMVNCTIAEAKNLREKLISAKQSRECICRELDLCGSQNCNSGPTDSKSTTICPTILRCFCQVCFFSQQKKRKNDQKQGRMPSHGWLALAGGKGLAPTRRYWIINNDSNYLQRENSVLKLFSFKKNFKWAKVGLGIACALVARRGTKERRVLLNLS